MHPKSTRLWDLLPKKIPRVLWIPLLNFGCRDYLPLVFFPTYFKGLLFSFFRIVLTNCGVRLFQILSLTAFNGPQRQHSPFRRFCLTHSVRPLGNNNTAPIMSDIAFMDFGNLVTRLGICVPLPKSGTLCRTIGMPLKDSVNPAIFPRLCRNYFSTAAYMIRNGLIGFSTSASRDSTLRKCSPEYRKPPIASTMPSARENGFACTATMTWMV